MWERLRRTACAVCVVATLVAAVLVPVADLTPAVGLALLGATLALFAAKPEPRPEQRPERTRVGARL